MSPPPAEVWIQRLVTRLGMVFDGTVEIDERRRGWCCARHQLELKDELDLIHVSLTLPPGLANPEFGKLLYRVLMSEADNDGWHEVVHTEMDPEGFAFAVRLRPQPQEESGATS